MLNGKRLPPPAGGERPSRGELPLAALRSAALPDQGQISRYDGFHLVRADLDGIRVTSWDGATLRDQHLAPGDHIVVNRGIGIPDDPVVARFLPLLASTPSPDPSTRTSVDSTGRESTVDAWGGWLDLAAGDGLDPGEPGALLVRREFDGRQYGSTSVSLVALSPGAVRYDFSGSPWDRDAWRPVLPEA